jgi:DNA repair protein RadD
MIKPQAMKPRPYQAESIEALHNHICTRQDNPAVVLPTGAGKSPVIAWTIQKWKTQAPHFRVIVLAHVKELVDQNADKMRNIWPDAPIGIYSAGLNKRDMGQDVTFASIDSVYKKGPDFDPFDVIIVDEAHRIPVSGEGKYRRFINDCKLQNPKLRVVGFTATPYRMGSGPICHKDHILNHVVYNANVADLIGGGYLCKLRSKAADAKPDMSGVHKRAGEYIAKDLSKAVDRKELVTAAVAEAVKMHADRKSVIYFCVDVAHCEHVSAELLKHGIDAPAITGKTKHAHRDKIARRFAAGSLRAVCNVNVLTEGFDATGTDCVVLFRPTLSKGLYVQMVGRGLRTDPRKTDCLVLDFASCIDEHGPIDIIDDGDTRLATCQGCKEIFSRAVKKCPACGEIIPPQAYEQPEAVEEPERRMHGVRATSQSIISTQPERKKVTNVFVALHKKQGKPDSLRVCYQVGVSVVNEWVCLDHDGYAGRKAATWWRKRFDCDAPSVKEALEDMFLAHKLIRMTKSITIKPGKYREVLDHELDKNQGTGL